MSCWSCQDEGQGGKRKHCLTTVEVLSLMEVCQVLVVSEDMDGERGSVEVIPPGFQDVDDCKEFLVVDVIVSFSWDE